MQTFEVLSAEALLERLEDSPEEVPARFEITGYLVAGPMDASGAPTYLTRLVAFGSAVFDLDPDRFGGEAALGRCLESAGLKVDELLPERPTGGDGGFVVIGAGLDERMRCVKLRVRGGIRAAASRRPGAATDEFPLEVIEARRLLYDRPFVDVPPHLRRRVRAAIEDAEAEGAARDKVLAEAYRACVQDAGSGLLGSIIEKLLGPRSE